MIFFLQISVLILMVSFFNLFIANIESENGVTLSPSLTGFASVDVSDNSGIIANQLDHQVLNIGTSSYNESLSNLRSGKTTAFLVVPENFTKNIYNFQTSNLNLFVNYGDPKRSVASEEVNTTVKAIASSISNQWINSLIPENKTVETDVKEESKGESLPLQLIQKMMIAVLLFLPLFLFGNMVIDSIVGEKERKTGEILIAMPLNHSEVIIGKNLAVISVIALQVALWMIILLIAGFDLKNPLPVYIVIVLTAIPIVGITSIVAAYSKNYKEAGIGLSFVYIGVIGFLIVPALAYIARPNIVANISPMTLVMRLFSGENISTTDLMIPIASIIILSLISYWISIKLIERDDIMFGPRPGLMRFTLELVGIKKVSRR